MFTGGSLQSEGLFATQQKAFDLSGCIFRSQASFLASFTLLGKSPQTAIAWRADTAAESAGYFFAPWTKTEHHVCSRASIFRCANPKGSSHRHVQCTAIARRADTEGEMCMMFCRTGQKEWTSGCSRQGHQRCNKTYGTSTCTEQDVPFYTADGDSSTLVFTSNIQLELQTPLATPTHSGRNVHGWTAADARRAHTTSLTHM